MRVLCSAIVLLLVSTSFAGDRWPEYRGPKGNGHADATGLPLEFGETKNVRWKTEIHGKGWSSPVVWDGQVWLTTATEDGKRMYALCVDLESGAIRHDLLVFENEEPQYCHPMNSYATPTPVIEEGRVYVHFGAHGTACLDTATGEKLWERRDLPCNHFRGPASSPILHGERLYIHFDGFDHQYVVCLEKNSGKTVWKKDRSFDYGTDNGDRKKAYCTPQIIEAGGRLQLLSPAAVATVAYDPASGEELWTVRHGGMNASARPLFGHGLAFITNGMGGLVAVSPTGSDDVTGSHVAWSTRQSVAKKSSQLLVGGEIYMVSDNGIFSCLDAKTGKTVWRERLGGEYAASPVYADGRIYFFSRDGECPVLAPGSEFRLLAENRLGDGFMASPAVVGRSLIVRCKSHLYRLEKQEP